MLNHKHNLYLTGAFALCALSACSTDSLSTAGSTTMPNAEAKRIVYHTDSLSVVSLNGIQINAYSAEKGVTITCEEDQKFYDARVKVNDDNRVEKYLSLHKFGNDCDSIFNVFKMSCGSDNAQLAGTCDESGNLETYCTYTDNNTDYVDLMTELWQQSNKPCNQFEYINMLHTLDRYTEQFTDDPTELSFDSHVLAYHGNMDFDKLIAAMTEIDEETQNLKNPRIRELSANDIPKYFPMTATIAKDNIHKGNCKTYIVFDYDASQPTGHALTRISKDTIEITSIGKGGMGISTNAYFPVAFLVQDCEGLIDENSTVISKSYIAKTWCSPLISKTTEELQEEFMDEDGEWHWPSPDDWQSTYKPNPNCGENGHGDVDAYGEWYRADLKE